ncbi:MULTISPECIES: shikimate kinase AroL [Pseudodesulfovibrio]|nr:MULTISPECIES: shikimate kinase AroL [Pseudodesulfovibrio]MCG2734117.1 shikimate kinase AroL [Pseudodesulfovibrio aespoeensis]
MTAIEPGAVLLYCPAMNLSKHVFLIGPRACGKTSVGRALACRLGCGFVDTDHAVVAAVGMEIAAYVAQHGWDAFRDRETEALERAVASSDGAVVGCGGGIVLRQRNRDILKTGITLYLEASVKTLAARLAQNPNEAQRPSLTGRPLLDEVREILAERAPLYEACADAILPEAELDQIVTLAETEVRRLGGLFDGRGDRE